MQHIYIIYIAYICSFYIYIYVYIQLGANPEAGFMCLLFHVTHILVGCHREEASQAGEIVSSAAKITLW